MISLNNKEQQGNVSRSYKLYKHTSPFMYDLPAILWLQEKI